MDPRRPAVLFGVLDVGLHRLKFVVVTIGCTAPLLPADHPLLLEQARAVPGFDAISNAPRHGGRRRRQPSWDRRPWPPRRSCPGLLLFVPSLNPSMFRGVDCSRVVEEVRPSQVANTSRQRAEPDAGQVADGVHSHLRVIRARLHRHVTATLGGVEDLVGETSCWPRAGRWLTIPTGPCRPPKMMARTQFVSVSADAGRPSASPGWRRTRDCLRSHHPTRSPESSCRPSWSTAAAAR